ncbi:MAG: ATP-dependent DNA helicase PcrA [Syntrophorhabdaceae bacterium PtaU1.Bin034]|nr:MAG: ATP-dependent DNA helicase PcrA [Syntrophorhabdaceae bacterium PtaU1.Bin034]
MQRSHAVQNIKTQLNAAQYEAVTTTEGPVLVIAGAGSGKTRVIEYRSLYLVQQNVDPESILLLTFTRRSAQEMIQRASRNDTRCAKIDGGTFHSFASKVLRRVSLSLGFSGSFTIYDEGDAEEAIRRCCNKMGYDQDKEFPKKNELKTVFSVCVNKGMSVDDAVQRMYSDYEDFTSEIKTVQKEYMDYKRRNNCLDYDDLLIYLKLALDNEELRDRISSRYRYIMVDEFQDTNGVQADIAQLLARKNGNIMAVGDDAQSIYGFRGANHLNILEFPKRFPGCKVIKLEENYRSTQPILDVGNAVLSNMKHKFEKRLVSGPGLKGEKPALRRFDDIYEEAAWVADRVQSLRAQSVPMREIAILFRTAYTSMPLQSELIKKGIRFKLFGGRKFYETAHVRDVISYLRIVANPADELAWHRVLLLLPGIGTRTVERLLELISSEDSLPHIIDKAITPFCAGQKHSDVLSSFRTVVQSIDSPSLTPAARLDKVIAHYDPIMKAKYKKDASRAKELFMLRNMAQRYDSLKEFLADVSVDPDKEGPDDSEYVTLSTVHSAKGLEWDKVFLIGLVDGVFPSGRSLIENNASDIEEEQRLFYVAVTRAKQELSLSFYDKGSGEKGSGGLCRFIVSRNVKETIEERGVAAAIRRPPAKHFSKRRR